MSFSDEYPHPGNNPRLQLRHVLNLHPDRKDEDFAIEATVNQYSNGETTGLTWGSLRAIADKIGA